MWGKNKKSNLVRNVDFGLVPFRKKLFSTNPKCNDQIRVLVTPWNDSLSTLASYHKIITWKQNRQRGNVSQRYHQILLTRREK